ncbi:restriction endonuclease subunit S [Streptomyces sp. NPDC056337]|uniref:restriction endonuclease subunit S n=1 Tax=Streptomyces sp. NPDC056337 TaxID=3345787 RepID=UPI0035E07666
MSQWPEVPFLEALTDVSARNVKIPKTQYLATGVLPVIDQGQKVIAGFVDDPELAHKEPGPLIVFGDHTRIFKFVDFPFAMGADGVKVLRPRSGFDPKFLYHYLLSAPVPGAGYSRHFKFLKEISVPRPPMDVQQRIAAVLDCVEGLRTKRREAAALLDELVSSIVSRTLPRDTETAVLDDVLGRRLRNGISPSSKGTYEGKVLTLSALTRGGFDASAWKNGLFESDPIQEHSVKPNVFMLVRGNGNKRLVGGGGFSPVAIPDTAYPDTVLAAPIREDLVVPEYLEVVWKTPIVRRQVEDAARTTNGTFKVNQKTMGAVRIPLPGMDWQREFQQRVRVIRRVRDLHRDHLATLDELFASIQKRAFRGTPSSAIMNPRLRDASPNQARSA